MAFPVLLDTNVLFGGYLCDSILRLAEAELFRPLWSEGVLDELSRNLIIRGLRRDQVDRRIGQMRRAFPDAMVEGYEPLIAAMTCDPKDRHVLAAAVRANAEILVTFNLGDFPESSTAPYDITAVHPDDFLLDQLDLYPGLTVAALHAQSAAYAQPTRAVDDVLDQLAKSGVPRFAVQARRHL